jgi:hypothetical protein
MAITPSIFARDRTPRRRSGHPPWRRKRVMRVTQWSIVGEFHAWIGKWRGLRPALQAWPYPSALPASHAAPRA